MEKKNLRIVFMGTPEFAVGSLQRLVENGYNVVAVVTQPDKPVGRHASVLRPSPVKEYALAHGLPVLQPLKMKDEQFLDELRSYGVPLTDGEDAGVVCVGFDTTLTYEKLERAVHFIRRGAAFVAANPDWVCPMAAGEVMPDCGSICALLTASTGVKPLYIGKPNRDMVDIISNHTGVPNSVICCVGDRLYTDIAVAVNAGAQSVLVMSGETTPEILAESETKPGWVMADVAELADVLKAQ